MLKLAADISADLDQRTARHAGRCDARDRRGQGLGRGARGCCAGGRAGFERGDVILSINGQEIKRVHDLPLVKIPHPMHTALQNAVTERADAVKYVTTNSSSTDFSMRSIAVPESTAWVM